jgi:branched-subunit amino acid transport protein
MSHGIPFFVYILASAAATILVREIPYWFSFLDKCPPFLKKCMKLLPIAALGALIFPGVLTDFLSKGEAWYPGVLGILAAFLIGLRKLPMVVSIVASILVTYLFLVV